MSYFGLIRWAYRPAVSITVIIVVLSCFAIFGQSCPKWPPNSTLIGQFCQKCRFWHVRDCLILYISGQSLWLAPRAFDTPGQYPHVSDPCARTTPKRPVHLQKPS